MNRIKELRTKHNMLQSELAFQLNFRQNTLSNWETGRSEPPLDALTAMAKIFGVSIDYLLGQSEKKAPTTEVGDGLDPEMLAMLRLVPPEKMEEVKRYLRFQAEQQ